MDRSILSAAVVAGIVAVLAVPLEYILYQQGIMTGAQAAAGWGIGIGVAFAFGLVYLWRTR